MMYSDHDIKEAIKRGSLIVDPYVEDLVRPGGLGMRLGNHLLKPKAGTVIDPKNHVLPEYDEIIMTEDKPYQINPGEFILGHTYEKVTVGSDIGFFIEGRSTLARIGLTIVQTAMIVYPGHRNRTVTLELANHGPNPILLYPLMKVARAAIFELKTPTTIDYDLTGKYRDQVLVGKPLFEKEFI
ncbi:MAG: dCTP deaminase [Deltaproteobacteria bacterium]|nr:dCTP deaminase [Deltaproteobacteria bacterium]